MAESLHEQLLLTIPEVARILRVSQMTIRRQINVGAIKAIRVGGSIRIQRDEISAYLDRLSNGGK